MVFAKRGVFVIVILFVMSLFILGCARQQAEKTITQQEGSQQVEPPQLTDEAAPLDESNYINPEANLLARLLNKMRESARESS